MEAQKKQELEAELAKDLQKFRELVPKLAAATRRQSAGPTSWGLFIERYRLLVRETRDALKWITAFSVAGTYSVGQRLQAAETFPGWAVVIAFAAFLISVLAGVFYTMRVDLHVSYWFERLKPGLQEQRDFLKSAAEELSQFTTDLESSDGSLESLRPKLPQFLKTAERLENIYRDDKVFHVPELTVGTILAAACAGGFAAGVTLVGTEVLFHVIRLALAAPR